ncbi:hypothetical protein L1987_20464 [Smallanthus sonchifolius]|uniref:Uncharacterized protein n=1 Tax=Smallanthus sonchifolius TaxID=185202 RepID=A0ACB9ITR4_9ASTR|nr:hypothetical protein L1987_20464 [Smallanthus sonchifolius]
MLGRDYPKTRTVFSPRAPVNGEAVVAPSQVESDGVRVSHSPEMHVHVPAGGIEHMHGVHDEQGSNLDLGIASEVGVHVSCVPDGLGVPMQAHEVNTNLEVDMEGLHGTLGTEAGANEMVTNVASDNDNAGLDVKKTGETGNKGKKSTSRAFVLMSMKSESNFS